MDWRRNTVDEVPPRTADSLRASFHKAIPTISREVQRIREQYNRVSEVNELFFDSWTQREKTNCSSYIIMVLLPLIECTGNR